MMNNIMIHGQDMSFGPKSSFLVEEDDVGELATPGLARLAVRGKPGKLVVPQIDYLYFDEGNEADKHWAGNPGGAAEVTSLAAQLTRFRERYDLPLRTITIPTRIRESLNLEDDSSALVSTDRTVSSATVGASEVGLTLAFGSLTLMALTFASESVLINPAIGSVLAIFGVTFAAMGRAAGRGWSLGD